MKKGFYVYKHLNLEGEVIYVGRTINMNDRQGEHSKKAKHKHEIECVEYAELQTKTAMMMYEFYYISKHNPKGNTASKWGESVEELKGLPELTFKKYERAEHYNTYGKTIKNIKTIIPNSKYRGEVELLTLERIEEDNQLNIKQWKLLMYIMNSIANVGYMTEKNDYLGYLLHEKPKNVQYLMNTLENKKLIQINYFNDLEGMKRVIHVDRGGNSPIECEMGVMCATREKNEDYYHGEMVSWEEFRYLKEIIPYRD